MKKLILAGLLIVSAFGYESKAQISVNINIGSQPAWGPTGYNHVDFYYLPDINVYYDVTRAQYIYQNGAQWTYVNTLPSAYRNFDIYNSYKVVVNEPKPYLNNKSQKLQYAKYKGKKNQAIIRDSKDERYYVSSQHPQHQTWEKQQHNQNQKVTPNRNNNNNNDNRNKGTAKENNGGAGRRN